MSLNYKNRRTLGNVWTLVFIIIFLLFTIVPLITIVITAGKTQQEVFNKGPFSKPENFLSNFSKNIQEAWTTGKLGRSFVNSIIITIPSVLLTVSLSCVAGYALAKVNFWGRDVVFLLFLLGLMLPFQATMISLYFLMRDLHLLNTYWSVIFASAGVSFGIFMMRSFFMGLPNELIEAAKIDGCSEFQAFWKVMLPLVYPAAFSLTVFQFMWSWNSFLVPLLFITSMDKRPVALSLMFFQTRYSSEHNLIAAAVIISSLPVIGIYLILQSRFEEGITLGAFK